MQLTDYHAKYYAHELTKRCPSDSVEKLAASLIDAQVDLNPHQVEAALFAFKSPLSMGAILADEVGLGKTIEAGMVISQRWAERKRKILIIVPSSLRKQWNQELLDKFFLPSHILEARTFNAAIKRGKKNPFGHKEIVICSYHFARNKAEFLVGVKWDLVIIDEAHRLRNVYKPSNKIARTLKGVLAGTPKILLTATPLQNSLLELYGLVSFIDEYAFGDIKSFRAQYTRLTNNDTYAELKARLAPICKRTLRRQVLEYIKYTNRIPITQEFIPSPQEEALYDMVSDYLRRENLQALPASQRTLMTLVLRKLLASSTFAIAGALDSLVRKLKGRLRDNEKAQAAADEELAEDYEGLEELQDEWEDGEEPDPLTQEDIEAIESEITDLEAFRDLAVSISENAKGEALISALKVGFEKAVSLGAARKAVIFTESRRTQAYLISLLEQQGYEGKICLFNGSNSDPGSRAIYADWKERHADSDRVTGSRTADLRSALVDFFKTQADIMIATEAAAEGINLQFCSLVVNYDLPWNPQRIEQRIGRCHRYGQKHDVVVVNFLNRKNAADQRVFELLAEKFQLFSGVFGASDEVLGSIESGVDLEKRIVAIYQGCRTTDEIQFSFDALQAEMGEQIDENIQNTRRKLLENFDEEVHEKLRVNLRESRNYLNKYETMLWDLTQYALAPYAEFYEGRHAFMLQRIPFDHVTLPLGPYEMGRDIENAHIYRIGHPVAQHILKLAGERQLAASRLVFDYTGYPAKVSVLEPLVGESGSLMLNRLTVEALDAEDYLIFGGVTGNGSEIEQDQCRRLFSLPGRVEPRMDANERESIRVDQCSSVVQKHRDATLEQIGARNATFFDQEMDKLDHWAGDRRATLKTNLKEMDDQIKELKKQVRHSSSLPEKIELQKKVKTLDKKRDDAWREYDEAAKEIEGRKDELIDAVEARLKQNITETTLFEIEWEVR